MTEFTIHPSLDIPAGSPLTADAFPNLAHAVRLAVAQAHKNWIAYASGAPLPDGRHLTPRSGTYARSIQHEMRGDFSGEIFTHLSYASALEDGQAAWDMHRMLDTSFKTRRTKDGKRYLIVPFRWGTPGTVGFRSMLPETVWKSWTSGGFGESSRIVGHEWRESGTGAWSVKTRQPYLVRQRIYSWGGRTTERDLIGMGVGAEQARRMAGMVRMQRKGGGHTQYLTFRTMSEGSPGWMHPAVPGYHIARTVSDVMRPICEQLFVKAVEADVAAVVGG